VRRVTRVLEPTFDAVGGFARGRAAARQSGKFGFIDRQGKWLIEPRFEMVRGFVNGLAAARDRAWGLIDEKGAWCVPPKYLDVGFFEHDLVPVLVTIEMDINGAVASGSASGFGSGSVAGSASATGRSAGKRTQRWGLVDRTGNFVVQPCLTCLRTPASRKDCVLLDNNKKMPLAEAKALRLGPGEKIVAADAGPEAAGSEADVPDEHIKVIMSGGCLRFVDRRDRHVIGEVPDCRTLSSDMHFHDGVTLFIRDNLRGFCRRTGEVIVAPTYHAVKRFGEGLAAVSRERGGLWGFIDVSGKMVIEPKYKSARWFSQGLAAVNIDGQFGFIDKAGQVKIAPQYANAGVFHDGKCWVETASGTCGFIDTTGKMVIEAKFEKAGNFADGLAPVKNQGRWGFIDAAGKMVIDAQYDDVGNADIRCHDAESFVDGRATVKIDGKWGIIDTTGNVVVPCEHEFIQSFAGGLTVLKGPQGNYFIDTAGNKVDTPVAP